MLFSLSATIIQAQDREDKKTKKEIRKAEERARHEKNLDLFRDWIDNRDFIILTDNISGRYGAIYNLQPSVNFIKVEGDEITIQTSQPHQVGSNGIGGLTTEGPITSMKVLTNEQNEPISVLINFTTPALGPGTVNIHVNGSGNASAYIRGNWGRMATFRGEFANSDSTNIFEGMRRF
jgi:hypothetical protein